MKARRRITATVAALMAISMLGAAKAQDEGLLLVADELSFGHRSCCGLPLKFAPGAESAPDRVIRAFGSLSLRGYDYARPARIVHWEKENTDYWIQWTIKDDETALWAYDPVDKKVVQVLRVKEKLPSN